MKNKRFTSFAVLILGSLLLTGCGGGFGASSWPGITVAQESNTAYLAYNQHVYALDTETGQEQWRFPQEADNRITFFAAPQITEDGQLLVAGYNNVLYSLDPQSNGSLNWQFAGGDRFVGSPLAGNEIIYAPNTDHVLYALSAQGELLWTFRTEEPQWAQPASNGQEIYLTSMDHFLYALDAQGNQIWQQDLGGTILGRPAFNEDGILYVGTFGREVLAVNSQNGRIIWRADTRGWVWGGPRLVEDAVYVGDLDGQVYAFKAQNGRELWQANADGAITGTPLVANEQLYVGTEGGKLLSLTLDGRIRWTRTVEGQLYGSPQSAGDLILVGAVGADSILMAFDSNGNIAWSFVPES